jgi:hypothetical protein
MSNVDPPKNRRRPGADWATRRPNRFGGDAPTRDDPLRPPTMSRSRVQIATSYAPGVLLTWEGGKGICRSVPIDKEKLVKPTTESLIYESMREYLANWQSRVRAGIQDFLPEFALDRSFFDARTETVQVDPVRFKITSPDVIGYIPYPLVYRCSTCGSVREYASVAEQARRPLPHKCHGHRARWTQVDVVYVHWSGNIEPLSPFNYNYDQSTGGVRQISVCTCGSQHFRLKNTAPIFAEWRYVCEGCGESRSLKKADPEVLQKLQSDQNDGGRQFQWIEVNMLPVSYRANSAYYPQRNSFIEFEDGSVVELMTQERTTDLVRRLAIIHNIPFAEPSDEKIQQTLRDADRFSEWEEFEMFRNLAKRAETAGRSDEARKRKGLAADEREKWFREGLIRRGGIDSPSLSQAVLTRGSWARRYDPIRLTVQHDAFVREHIGEAKKRHAAVDVLKPDVTLTDVVHDPEALRRYQVEVGGLLKRIGVKELVLVRGLPICEFSFGYTRVSPTPVYQREFQGRAVAMPVRLKAFDTLPDTGGKHPIYVTEQKNEALYFRLGEDRVRRWLEANCISDLPDSTIGLGRAYLETYADFGPFLDEYKDKQGSGTFPRMLAPYVYLLLHSLSHQVMHSLADVSGLDRDGIGEHIFPADLSFVVYRKGMTPDLGNISAMWRNHSGEFLKRMIDQRTLRCGSGSLCDVRGGACPACIMVSEVSCISSNLLLSRAALKGGPKPEWEPIGTSDIIGFFDARLLE